jgi:hypothetical protein
VKYRLGRLGFFMHPARRRQVKKPPATTLRALPVERVNDLSMEALFTKPDTYAGAPILDGTIVRTGMPGEALRTRTAAKVPVVIGTTSDDLPVLSFLPQNNPFSLFGADAQAVYFTGAPNRKP